MANRRMISKGISVSEQVNALDDFAALLFSWLIPHADDYGVLHGTAKKLKALVIPMRKQTAEHIEKALSQIQQQGLIWRYIYKNEQYLQFCRWEEHQEGLHKRTDPKNPLFEVVKDDSENFREIPGNSPLIEPNRREGNIKEEKRIYAEFVRMFPEEYQKLVDKFGEAEAKDKIEALNLWKGSKGKQTASDYLTILNWDRRNRKENPQSAKPIKVTPDQAWQEVRQRLIINPRPPIEFTTQTIADAVKACQWKLSDTDADKARFIKAYCEVTQWT